MPIPQRPTAVRMQHPDQPQFLELVQRFFDSVFVIVDNRRPIALLIASGHDRFKRQRVILRRRQPFFDQYAQHSALSRRKLSNFRSLVIFKLVDHQPLRGFDFEKRNTER